VTLVGVGGVVFAPEDGISNGPELYEIEETEIEERRGVVSESISVLISPNPSPGFNPSFFFF